MNWEAIGAIGEILGALAVVATLVYLSVQIRQNTKVARSATRQAIAESAQSLTSDLIHTPDMAEIFLRHLPVPGTVSLIEGGRTVDLF